MEKTKEQIQADFWFKECEKLGVVSLNEFFMLYAQGRFNNCDNQYVNK